MKLPVSRRPLMRVARWLLVVVVVILLLPYVIAPLYRFGQPVSTLMLWRWMTGARVERIWAPLSAISPTVPPAVLAAEDAHFCKHWGVDLGELRAALRDAEEGGALRGGSTVTQQVAKNLFLWQGRSLVRKALEAPLAVWIDFVLPKRRVLEIYLNVAEWGPDGQFGIEAGARRAFNKSSRDLTLREAALMAAMLPNPVERNAARPGPGLRRLAGIHQARAVTMAGLDTCIRRR